MRGPCERASAITANSGPIRHNERKVLSQGVVATGLINHAWLLLLRGVVWMPLAAGGKPGRCVTALHRAAAVFYIIRGIDSYLPHNWRLLLSGCHISKCQKPRVAFLLRRNWQPAFHETGPISRLTGALFICDNYEVENNIRAECKQR